MATDRPDGDTALLDLDNDYDSEEDEDFQLDEDDAGEDDDALSSSEGEDDEAAAQEQRPSKKRKLGGSSSKKDDDGEIMELDSGDEATIQKARQRKKMKGAKGGDDDEDDIDFDDDDEGGEGGFVKTRAMRMRMQEERKPLAKIEGATIDVDAIWEKMNTPGTDSGLLPTSKPENEEKEKKDAANGESQAEQQKQETKLPSEEMIKIKRTYKFAGEVITEEKLVPKDSAEAKLYLSQSKDKPVDDAEAEDAASKNSGLKLRRPLRKYSRFDPNPPDAIKKSWEKQPTAAEADSNKQVKGPKLNTVEKSRLDWAEYVDQAGIKDELNVHSKAKEGYLGRMEFLSRVDAKQEEERRRIRLKGL